jgi:uncharacterized protein YwbE
MSHQIRTDLTDLKALTTAVKELEHYTTTGGYRIESVSTDGSLVTWHLAPRPVAAAPKAGAAPQERRRTVEAGDLVIVETKGQQMTRRFGGLDHTGVEGTVFRVLTRGPHPHGMKVELRDRSVGRVIRNLTVPGAGEPSQR